MPRPRSSSGFKGVYLNGGRYLVLIKINKKVRYLGRFHDPVEAARYYDSVALREFGPDAETNTKLGLL